MSFLRTSFVDFKRYGERDFWLASQVGSTIVEKNGSDSVVSSEFISPSGLIESMESAFLSELGSLQALVSSLEASFLSEFGALQSVITALEAHSCTDTVALARLSNLFDSQSLSELSTSSLGQATGDSLDSMDVSLLGGLTFHGDTSSVSEDAVLGAALSLMDAVVVDALVGLSYTAYSEDASVLTDTADIIQAMFLVGADSYSLGEVCSFAPAFSSGDVVGLDESANLVVTSYKQVFDSLMLMLEAASYASDVGSPLIKLPTNALLTAWASMITLGAYESNIDIDPYVRAAAVALHQAGLSTVEHESDADVASTLSSVVLLANE